MSWNIFPWAEWDREGRAVFIYDLDRLKKRAHEIRTAFQKIAPSVQINFSLKSNPHPRILQTLHAVLDGFDVSSKMELELCERLGIPGSRISVSGPGKTDACLRKARELQVRVLQVDSLDELLVAQDLGIDAISFRVHTPDIFSTKLGLSELDLQQALEKIQKPAMGLHLYLGRESFSWARFSESARQMQKCFQTFPASFIEKPHLFVGPGIPAAWSGESEGEAIEPIQQDLTVEVGRGLVASSGFYAVPILACKSLDRGGQALIVHGGLQHLGSPFVSFAQKVQDLHATVLRKGQVVSAEETQEYLVAGSLCLGHDILHPRLKLPAGLERGDWILFPQAGAYGLSAGVPFFIGQDLPREIVFENGQWRDETVQGFKLYQECFD